MTREDKIKAGNSVFSGSGYADTLVEELTELGLTVIDTRDEELISKIGEALIPLWYQDDKTSPAFSRRHVVLLIMEALRENNDRKKKIGMVPGKKPKKEKK